MPVEQRTGTSQVTAVVVGVVAVVVAVAAAWGLLSVASGGDGPVQINLGDDEFDAGQINRISTQIAENGPVLYSDVSGRGQVRPVWLNHFGDDPEQQWFVFSAIAPGAPDGCFVTWNAEENLFDERRPDPDDPQALGELCRDVTFSSTGEGLETYTWTIDGEDNLIVDLRDPVDGGADTDGG